jgi:hypothetical protein
MRTPRPTGKMLALRVVVDQAELVGWCEGPAVRSTLQRNLGLLDRNGLSRVTVVIYKEKEVRSRKPRHHEGPGSA